ncbi:hypothetical protein [Pyxidicoccus xibeiensis]|uniref:hypothetical protein n=1 Tax=Pyxidicoccus xibeiensis TaxID=2906759 RepID=UPI0020A7C046|nr:hypothetical protein [Pyxidicoccus xibeiensis]MCP3143384.1 hypothetical protein [Pyxidicoccus xibeiensis]
MSQKVKLIIDEAMGHVFAAYAELRGNAPDSGGSGAPTKQHGPYQDTALLVRSSPGGELRLPPGQLLLCDLPAAHVAQQQALLTSPRDYIFREKKPQTATGSKDEEKEYEIFAPDRVLAFKNREPRQINLELGGVDANSGITQVRAKAYAAPRSQPGQTLIFGANEINVDGNVAHLPLTLNRGQTYDLLVLIEGFAAFVHEEMEVT